MGCPLMLMILILGLWKRMTSMLKVIVCTFFALVTAVALGDVHMGHNKGGKLERMVDVAVKGECVKAADRMSGVLKTELEDQLNKKFDAKSAEIDRLAKEHISFLTDKINFLTILVTVVFAFFGISSIVVTVTSSKKLIEYIDAYNAMCEKSNRAVEAIAVAEKKMFRVQSRTCYHVAKNALVLYKSLNQTSPTTEPEKEKRERAVRRENLKAFLINLRYGMRYALDAGDNASVYNYVTNINPLLEALKINNGANDIKSLHNSFAKSRWPDSKEILNALSSMAIRAKMKDALLKSYADLLDMFS